MRTTLTAFTLAAALAGGTAVVAYAQASFSDAQVASYANARKQVAAINSQVTGGKPTAEQQAAMAKAVTDAGLTIESFNAIATAAQKDAVLRARIAVAEATPSPAGSVGASVTEDEMTKFSAAMAKLRVVAAGVQNNAPTDAQKAEMNSIVAASGLTVERFNAIATAIPQDPHLKARVLLADARRGGA